MTDPLFVREERIPVAIEKELKRSYLDYAMSVIIGRAIPDARHRRAFGHRPKTFRRGGTCSI